MRQLFYIIPQPWKWLENISLEIIVMLENYRKA